MRAALYEKDITPPLGCYMSGSYADLRATDVLDPLHVRAIVLENNNEAVAIVEIDLCEFHDELHDEVADRINEYTGIPSKNILISANHTHKGIPVYDSPEINAFADSAFTDVVYRLIADCVILAYKRLDDVSLSFGKSKAEGIAFNRNFIMKDGTYRTNVPKSQKDNVERYLGTTDEEVPVLFVKDKEGKPKGALVSFACHQDVTPGNAYSGGFSSIMSKELKKKYGNDFITVYVPGASGDINHINIFGTPEKNRYITMGKILSEAVCDAYAKSEPLKDDTLLSKKEKISIRKRTYTKESILEDVKEFAELDKEPAFIRNILFYQACNKEDTKEVYVQCIKIGDVFVFGYSGEIFVQFGLDLKKRVGSDKIIIATLANCYCGYVPTKDSFAPNSRLYEKKLCFGSYLCEDAGYMMNDKLFELSK